MHKLHAVFLLLCAFFAFNNCQRYNATWDSLDTRPLPEWYDKQKIGIFIHWGVFSVPSFGSEWFWNYWRELNISSYVDFMDQNYPPHFTYQQFANDFTAQFFDPYEWVDLFNKSGAKYVVLTSKHHEGFTLWPSNTSYSWNSVDIGPHRNIVEELAIAVRQANLTFGLYHSMFEWFNPVFLKDAQHDFRVQDFVRTKYMPELYDLIHTYKPAIWWSDGDGGANHTYWNATEFLAWLYNDSPVKDYVVVNDRWGNGIPCNHGDFYTCNDRYNPGKLQGHKWENAMTLDRNSWGYRRNARLEDYLTTHELIVTMVQTVSCGGNILINVGPTKDGVIAPIFQDRLLGLGAWLEMNGEAIYESTPWAAQNDSITDGVWYTMRDSYVYAIVLDWPEENTLHLGSIVDESFAIGSVWMLGIEEMLEFEYTVESLVVTFPDKAKVANNEGWVLKFVPLDLIRLLV